MNVLVRVLFKPPTDEDWREMRRLAATLTNNPQSVRVSADDKPGWLVAEFTMRTEAQSIAVDRIGDALDLYAGNRQDSTIQFPYTAAQRARADRKNARRKAQRKAASQNRSDSS